MKRMLAITILTLFLPTTAAFAAVRITEVAWMGIDGANGQYGEWLELYNDGADTVDLAGWKLYGGTGNDLIFTLTKTISAGGYLLIERKTASMPDAVPGVNDESGTFGSGGLSNTGETLVLKDSTDTTVQSLDFSSGWPAGDAATKETMQWNGTKWVTAAPTPKAGLSETVVSGEDADTVDDTTAKKSTSHTPKVHTDPYVTIFAPVQVLPHVQYKFNVEVGLEHGVKNPSRGIYRWNFGDGTSLVQSDKINPVTHTYEYPGTYTVWFGYYESIFSIDPKVYATKVLTVQEPQINAEIVEGKAIRFTNETDDDLDLSNWIVHSGTSASVLPPMTLLSAGGSVVMSAATLGMTLGKNVSLAAPDDYLFVYKKEVTDIPHVIPVAAEVKGESVEVSATEKDDAVAVEDAVPNPKSNHTKEIIFGVVAFTIIGLFLLLERFMAQQE